MKTLLVLALVGSAACARAEGFSGPVVVTDYVKADGAVDVAAGLQRLINENPHRTIWFPDGTYLLTRPIATPADPKRSVDLRLSNYAILKAAANWTNAEAMVKLGGIHPANDIRSVGSCYGLSGGVIDGSGRAVGLSIDSGRETRVRDVSMKNVTLGVWIKKGANNGSSDADLSGVNIVGADPSSSVGVWVEGHDNTLSDMRIANVLVGVRLSGGGNMLHRIHPLYTGWSGNYEQSIGFEIEGNDNVLELCYSDHFSSAFVFGSGRYAVLENCIAWWYADNPGKRHLALRAKEGFRAKVTGLRIGFCGTAAKNGVLESARPEGNGVLRDLRYNRKQVNAGDDYLKFVRE